MLAHQLADAFVFALALTVAQLWTASFSSSRAAACTIHGSLRGVKRALNHAVPTVPLLLTHPMLSLPAPQPQACIADQYQLDASTITHPVGTSH
jgi:hypothetical protein